MIRPLLLFLPALAIITAASPSAQQPAAAPKPPASAAAAVAAAIESVGGGARLTSVTSIKVDTIGHEWALEQSERPEGPWMAHYRQGTEVRDGAGRRLRRQSQVRDWNFPKWSPEKPQTTVVANGAAAQTNGERWRAGSPIEFKDAEESFALAPERMLLTARDAADLKLGPSKALHGVANHSVVFTWQKRPVTIFLNSWTHRPTALQIVRADPFGIWGDVTETRWFGWWDLQKGLWYPRQVTVEWNGYPLRDTTTMELVVDAPVADAEFEIPADAASAFAAIKDRPFGLPTLTLDESKAVEIAPNVVQLAGTWNVLLVRQPDGIVIVEAPISSRYSEAVIAAAQKRFPDAPIKAVVTTSDAWPHLGGIREYVARKIPVYALDLNVPILERLVKSTRTHAPDTLSKGPVAPLWRPVSRLTTIGTGDLRLQVFPVRGEMGERMMLAYLPGLKLAYSSDLIQPGRTGGFFMPGMLAEVTSAFTREAVGTPERVVGMHLSPSAWSDIETAVRDARSR